MQQKQNRTSSGVQKATHIKREKRILFKKHLSFFWTHWAKNEGKKRGSGGGWPPAAENPPVMVRTFFRHLSLSRRAPSLFWFIFEKRKRAPLIYIGGKENCPSTLIRVYILTFSLCFHYIQAASTTTATTTTTKLSTLSTRTNESR